MTITGVSSNLAPLVQTTLDINKQLSDLTRQLGTGQKAATYAGLGPQSGIAMSLTAQLSALTSYDDTMTTVGTNLQLQQSVLQQIDSASNTVLTTLAADRPVFMIDSTGQTVTQHTATDQLGLILDLLNTKGPNGYMFSGTGVDQPSVASADQVLNGTSTQAGLKQVISERQQADLGVNGLGRLVIPAAAGTVVSVNEDVAGSPFGLKLSSVSSQLTGATATGPTGSPPAISVDLGATNPNPGDTISYTFTLPDGSSQTLTLTATTASPPAANQFTIGATSADTANNLQAALTAGVQQIGETTLSAASAVAAANNFFDDPPQRVGSAPPSSATTLVNGTSADTVFWYTGQSTSGPIRSTATARVDPKTTVSYGTQANEQGIRWVVQNIATLAATSYSTSDPNASEKYGALTDRLRVSLAVPNGVQSVSDIEESLASAQGMIQTTQNQHKQTANTLTNMLQSIEGVDQNTVGAQILSLQTTLSASLQTTARLAQLNLLNYLAPVTG